MSGSNQNNIHWMDLGTEDSLDTRDTLEMQKKETTQERKNRQIKKVYLDQLKRIRVLSKKDAQTKVGRFAIIHEAPTFKKGGVIKAVAYPSEVICRIYNLDDNAHIVQFVMKNIKLMNDIDNWRTISKPLRIPSLEQMATWLSLDNEYPSPEPCIVDQLKMLFSRDGTTAEHLSSEGGYDINRTIYAPVRIANCMFYGHLTMKLIFTINLESSNDGGIDVQMKNKVRYSHGDSKGWKPDATLLASNVYNKIGTAVEIGVTGIAAKYSSGDTTIEVKVGTKLSFKAQPKIYAIKLNDKIFKVKVAYEFEYQVLFTKCDPGPGNTDRPLPITEAIPNPFSGIRITPEEIITWATLMGVTAHSVYLYIDRAIAIIFPIFVPKFILDMFSQRIDSLRS